jgi:hypothetical protein
MHIEEAIETLKDTIRDIETNLEKYVAEGVKDWTVMMRKFAKIDHVLKISGDCIFFIENALKKQKI